MNSKLRACDLVGLRVRDIAHGARIAPRACVVQRRRSVRSPFEITQQAREPLTVWIDSRHLQPEDYLFPSRQHTGRASPPRKYARIVKGWVRCIGLDQLNYGTHAMRRTKASLIYQRTKNLRAVQLLLGHTKIESTVRYLGSRSTTP